MDIYLTEAGRIGVAEQYLYDAFISYRHLPLDEAIAGRVQKKLEQYRTPNHKKLGCAARIGRIFRDKTELPTSGDLGQSLTDALLGSRFLIVILSEETKNSKWCMEEIRAFKAAHGGSIDHILPVLVSGDPQTAIPEELRFEIRTGPDGEAVRVEVEPLCCDVRADSVKASCAKLKIEVLRLAAPLLGCGFDDLYRRHHRRSSRIRMAALAVMMVILGVISVFAYNSYVAQRQYERNLVDSYTRQGAEQLLLGNGQEALMYYAGALRLDPDDQAAETGALLLLQQNSWLRLTGRKAGYLVDGRPFCGERAGVIALNGDGSQTLLTGSDGMYLGDAAGVVQEELSGFGEFIASAEDGSCWTFADEEHVYFYFTEDGAVWKAPRPEKINPSCDMDMADVFADSLPQAMAVGRERAAVRFGGYLYLYSLPENGEAELFCEFDLENVYPDAAAGGLDIWNEMWVDADGELAVLYNNAHAALFDLNNSVDPCLNSVNIRYDMGLNDAAFSGDGALAALVYGNDYGIDGLDPGGFFEVYDAGGEMVMATGFDPAVALAGAAFEPGGTRLLVWGSSVLQVWDTATGEPAAVPLRAERISSAAWGEGGIILVDDGSGMLSEYVPVAFETAVEAAPAEDMQDAADVNAYEADLGGGLKLCRTAVRIWLEDDAGNELDEARFGDPDVQDFLFVNRMQADAEASVGYFWYNGHDSLYRISVDRENKRIAAAGALGVRGWPVVGVQACAGGAAAVTGNGYLLYYTEEDTTPSLTLQLGRSGIVKATASDESGLLAVLLRSTEYTDPKNSTGFEYRYSLELWDLNMGVRLGDLEDGTAKLEAPAFTDDGWLTYLKDGEPVALLLDAENPDEEEAAYLANVSCFFLNDEQYVETKPVDFPLPDGGIWNGCLRASHVPGAAAEEEKAESSTEKYNRIIRDEGIDAWLAYFDDFWNQVSQSDVTAAQTTGMFRYYFTTAIQNGCQDRLRTGFECVAGKLMQTDPKDSVHTIFHLLFGQYALTTGAYDDLLIDYWTAYADALEAQLDPDSDEWMLDFLSVYENRLYANLLRGEGTGAFLSAMDERDYDKLDAIMSFGLDVIYSLVTGDAGEAAARMTNLMRRYDELGLSREEAEAEKRELLLSVVSDCCLFMQRGAIQEEVLSEFTDALALSPGLHLTAVSQRNLASGLRLGDVVVEVSGERIYSNWQLYGLQEKYPTAELTVLRGEKKMIVGPMEDWVIVGTFSAE